MSWVTIAVIALGAMAFKQAGMFGLGARLTSARAVAIGALLPPALLAALVAVQTLSTDRDLVVDARAAGVAAGAIAVWRGAPFWLVVTVAAVVTASLRALS